MISLKEVTIHKYKCVQTDQTFSVDDDITILVGMNESGKTAILEALAKTNYFQEDPNFKFNATHDYPRTEKKKMEKSGQSPKAVTSKYAISDEFYVEIERSLGKGVLNQKAFGVAKTYDNKQIWLDIKTDLDKFITLKTRELGISSKTLNEKLSKAHTVKDIDQIISEYKEEVIIKGIKSVREYFENEWKWEKDPLSEYVARKFLRPMLPRYLYYDEYYALPSRISIEGLEQKNLDSGDQKTAKALFELADINIKELVKAKDFEDYKAELEATEAIITKELFEYWSTNKNLEIEFDIDKVEKTDPHGNRQIVEHVLDVRVRNNRTKVSLPLKNRSKGFNWFFSFLVWFKKIQEDTATNYILLLDEPGLNLHASAQADLLDFIEHLSKEYQIIYTSHSPFMVDPVNLHRVRTIVETDEGSVVSDSIQEKDPNTLFPLQAALGYDIAQNLFISKNNLIVEGVSDLIFLQVVSSILQENGKTSLRDNITIVPVGGLDKVSTFVSLLRGNKLNIACLLDSSIDTSNKKKLDNLIREKIIQKKKIMFYDEFIDGQDEADIEDIFSKAEYVSLFNQSFADFPDINEKDLNPDIMRIVMQINKKLDIEKYNHYRPANTLARMGVDIKWFSDETINRFEKIFEKINSLYEQ
jgi:predicted ATP-dependent endonuclease of OLD family